MFKKISFVLPILLLTAALPVNAAIIDINYSATITQVYGNHIGYSLGDKVEGLIKIDLSKSAGDQIPWADYLSRYTPLTGESNMVSGYSPATIGSGWDQIDLYNGSYNDNIMFSGDSLEIIDGSNEYFSDGISNIFRSAQLHFAFSNSAIVGNDDLNSLMDFYLGDLLTWKSGGAFVESTYISLSSSDYTFSYGSASFEFTTLSAKISNVSEPMSAGIFSIMLAPLLARRRVFKKSIRN